MPKCKSLLLDNLKAKHKFNILSLHSRLRSIETYTDYVNYELYYLYQHRVAADSVEAW